MNSEQKVQIIPLGSIATRVTRATSFCCQCRGGKSGLQDCLNIHPNHLRPKVYATGPLSLRSFRSFTPVSFDEVIDRPLALISLKKESLSECSEPASTFRPQIGGYMALVYTQMDSCYQEDESAYVHPHDPCRRFDGSPLDGPP